MREKETPVDLSFSLLWPGGKKTGTVKIRKQSAVDLDIQKLVEFRYQQEEIDIEIDAAGGAGSTALNRGTHPPEGKEDLLRRRT